MNYYNKILEIAKNNNGYVTTKEVVNNRINRMFLTNMVRNGNLVRASRGYYVLQDCIEDEYFKISSKSKYVRFSLSTALYLHNLSNRTPLIFNITLPNDYSGVLQKEKNVVITFVNKEILELGVEEMKSPFGTKIKVYNVEKTICDIIKNKKKMDAEIFSNALKEYVKSNNKDLKKLMKYAKVLNIEKKVREFMEVLL